MKDSDLKDIGMRVPRRARIQGSYIVESLKCRLESDDDEEEEA